MIRSRIYLSLVAAIVAILVFQGGWARWSAQRHQRQRLPALQQLVSTLSLTDLALWSEARYTRHPAMSDLFSPFQDHPGAMDHFPAGSLLAPKGPRPETTLKIQRRSPEQR